jgi:hypothetical protein
MDLYTWSDFNCSAKLQDLKIFCEAIQIITKIIFDRTKLQFTNPVEKRGI